MEIQSVSKAFSGEKFIDKSFEDTRTDRKPRISSYILVFECFIELYQNQVVRKCCGHNLEWLQ